jgi:hypothetical protein
MALHSRETQYEHASSSWIAECDCGWESERFPETGGGLKGHRQARRAYREHVESALGAEAYYLAPVACINCGSEHDQGLLIGTDVWSGSCERCGVGGRLRPNGNAIRERSGL